MSGDNNSQQPDIGLVNFFSMLTSYQDLGDVMKLIVEKLPMLLKITRCSIYLTPDFVNEYDGELINEEGTSLLSSNSIKDDFIVLAATNFSHENKYIGKIFYQRGIDLTGWVYETGKILNIKNSQSSEELKSIDKTLAPSVLYNSLKSEQESKETSPILYIPLLTSSHKIIGVLKLQKPLIKKVFSDSDVQTGTIVAQTLASVIENIQLINQQGELINALTELRSKNNPDEVIRTITKIVPSLFNCPVCEVYLRNQAGNAVVRLYRNGEERKNDVEYLLGEGFIGWVFKTGLPLIIENIHDFIEPVNLTNELLEKISDAIDIDVVDRVLHVRPESKHYIVSLEKKMPFLAVPILGDDKSVIGVLCAHFITKRKFIRYQSFQRSEIQRLKTFSSFITFAITSEKSRKKSDLLLQLGKSEDLDMLFQVVIKSLPLIISNVDCFIFTVNNSLKGQSLKLKASNRILSNVDITYELGQGKTGFIAKSSSTLIINHFGTGLKNDKQKNQQKSRVLEKYHGALIKDLQDNNNKSVGLIALLSSNVLSENIQQLFEDLSLLQATQSDFGITSEELDKYITISTKPSFTYLGVPIFNEDNELYGVITLTRPIESYPFSLEDVEFIESIANTLGRVINIIELQRRRQLLFTTIAHEINTHLTPLLSDAENISNELENNTDVRAMSSHLLGQVQRLQLMTETILSVMGKPKVRGEMQFHSLYRPLHEALKIYEQEAKTLGLEIILETQDSSNFPEIEMNLNELNLAFRSLIHNAIKYSFKPSTEMKQYRYIKIMGSWSNDRKNYQIGFQNYGVGITQEEIEKRLIFQPFYRGSLASDRNRTGSGFGLAYVAYVIEEIHHGEINVVCIRQEGGAFLTTFSVILPTKQ